MKTIVMGMRVALKSAELAKKGAQKIGGDIGLSGGSASKAVGAVAGAAQMTGAAVQGAANVAKTGVKTAKAGVKTAGKTAKMSAKALKVAIHAIQAMIHFIHACVTFLISLGTVGLIIFVAILLLLVVAVAGAVVYIMVSGGTSFSGGGTLGGVSSGVTGSSVVSAGDTTALYNACKTMGEWYLANVTTYQGNSSGGANGYVQWYDCDIFSFGTMQVGDECGHFAAAYGSLVSNKKIVPEGGIATIYEGSNAWESAGWKLYTITEVGGLSGLQPGDVMLASDMKDGCCMGGHAEVYLAQNTSFGWGQIQSKFPSNTSTMTEYTCEHDDIYVQVGSSMRYGHIYRYTGG